MSSLLALMSALTFGVSDFLGGIATRQMAVWVVVLWSHVAGLAVALLAVPLFGGDPTVRTFVWGAVAGATGLAGLVALYAGLARGRMAVVAPVSALVAAAVPALVGVATGDRLDAATTAGVLIALPAIVAVSAGGSMRAAGFLNGVVAGLGFAGFFLALALAPDGGGMWPLVAARVASILTVAVMLAVRGGVRGSLSRRQVGLVALVGVGDMVANIFYLLAVRQGMLASTVVLASLYPAVTVMLARLVLSERIRWWQWVGIVLTVVAIALIA